MVRDAIFFTNCGRFGRHFLSFRITFAAVFIIYLFFGVLRDVVKLYLLGCCDCQEFSGTNTSSGTSIYIYNNKGRLTIIIIFVISELGTFYRNQLYTGISISLVNRLITIGSAL